MYCKPPATPKSNPKSHKPRPRQPTVNFPATALVEAGTISGAHSIPLSQIVAGIYPLAVEKPLVLFCKSGQRSQKAAQSLLQKGYTEVFSLSGGILAWQAQI